MQPRFETIILKKLIGNCIEMSFFEDRTYELWRNFMPIRKEITNNVTPDLYSIEVYPQKFFDQFNPAEKFTKWAAIEVSDFDRVPNNLKTIVIPDGLYAIFNHIGPASEGHKTYKYIFEVWLPDSGYSLSNRPHFALMGEKYKGDDPSSEEEIWIPVKKNE